MTLLIVFTFAIEIGQRITKTGYMDFRDIVYGLGGFFLMFAIFFVIRLIITLIIKFIVASTEGDRTEDGAGNG